VNELCASVFLFPVLLARFCGGKAHFATAMLLPKVQRRGQSHTHTIQPVQFCIPEVLPMYLFAVDRVNIKFTTITAVSIDVLNIKLHPVVYLAQLLLNFWLLFEVVQRTLLGPYLLKSVS
jgi:hypothetical protein